MKHYYEYICILVFCMIPLKSFAADGQCFNDKCHTNINNRHTSGLWESLANCCTCHRNVSPDHPQNEIERLNKPIIDQSICFKCHRRLEGELKNSKYFHIPAKEGKCAECHLVHGNAENRFFRKPYPSAALVEYSADTYSLCWNCHDRMLAEMRNTDTHTNFRNGKRNLHYLHVNGKRGRPCYSCHERMHGSYSRLLVGPKFVDLADCRGIVIHSITDNGGACLVFCHRELSYDRTVKDY